MEYNVVTAFPSPIIQVHVEEDTSELLGHDQYTASFETRERFDHRDALASQRVLEKYPKTKQILLNKYISVAEDILKYRKRNYAITTSWFTLSALESFLKSRKFTDYNETQICGRIRELDGGSKKKRVKGSLEHLCYMPSFNFDNTPLSTKDLEDETPF